MSNVSKKIKALGEKNRKSMEDTTVFEYWAHKFLRTREKSSVQDFRAAWNYVHSDDGEDKPESDDANTEGGE